MAKKKLLVAAILVGAFAAVLLWLYAEQLDDEHEALVADQVEVVKAARNIPAGTPLTKDRITTEKVPRKFLPPNPLLESELNIYLGTPVAVNVEEGAMILTSDFSVAEVSRTLSSKIPPEERAMALAVDAISGVSGLLRPGDRVDILGTFPIGTKEELVEDAQGNKAVGYVTMTLLQNVTMLAVGQEISDVPSGDGAQRNGSYSTVTLSVTIDEAELLTIAQTRGKMTLLLRNREDVEVSTITKKTLREVLEDLEVIQEKRQIRIRKKPKAKVKAVEQIEIIAGDK
jgi:pilus assembly protein CpaB